MLLELLQRRFSCREFAPRKVPGTVIAYMLDCARLSPSGGNEQPWKFGVITDPERIKRIAAAASVNYDQSWVAKAPLLVVLCTQRFAATQHAEIGLRRFPTQHERLQEMDRTLYECVNMEEHQTKIPGEHMVIAGLEHGLCSTWISSVDCEAVAEIVGAEGYLVTNVIAFGYPLAPRAAAPKKSLADLAFTNHFQRRGFRA